MIIHFIKKINFHRYAPESLQDGKFSSRSDVWSYGVVLFETFSFGEDPNLSKFVTFDQSHSEPQLTNCNKQSTGGEGTGELLELLQSGARLPCPPTCTVDIYANIMYPCWNIESHKRPEFSKLCKDIKDLMKGL